MINNNILLTFVPILIFIGYSQQVRIRKKKFINVYVGGDSSSFFSALIIRAALLDTRLFLFPLFLLLFFTFQFGHRHLYQSAREKDDQR